MTVAHVVLPLAASQGLRGRGYPSVPHPDQSVASQQHRMHRIGYSNRREHQVAKDEGRVGVTPFSLMLGASRRLVQPQLPHWKSYRGFPGKRQAG